MKRKILSFFVIGMMILSICNIHSTISYASGVNLIIGRNADVPVFEPGEEVRFAIPIENIGADNANDVIVSLDTSDLEKFPFVIDKMATTRRISSINAHSDEDAVFYLKVALDAEAKIYPIKVDIVYSTEMGGGGQISQTVYVKIENNRKKPSLKLMDVKFEGDSLLSGQSTTMKLDIRNEGESLVKDLKISLEGLKADGIRMDGYMEIPKIKEVKAKHFQVVPIKLYADENLKSGTYELELSMKYKDEYNHEYEQKTKIYVPVEGVSEQELDFGFENLTYPKEGVNTSEDFTIAFDLKNLSEKDAKNLKVSVDGGSEILPKSPSIKNIKSLASGKSVYLEFVFFAKDGIESKNYPIKIDITYGLNGSEENHSISQYVGVYLKGDNSKLTPKIIIDDYNYGKEYIKTGEVFPLTMSFLNTNKNTAVRNIKVSLTSEGDTFAPVGSSNSFFINEIGPNARKKRNVKLKAKVDAEQKVYNVVVDIEYEDNTGKQYSAKETIGIYVIQEVRFETSDVKIPSDIFAGEPCALSIDYYNLGRGILRNMMIHTEGDFEIKDGSVYIGNMEAGKDDYYDVTIIPKKEGKFNGKIVFKFEDAVGNPHEIVKDFEINAQKIEEPPMPPEGMEMQKPKTSKRWIWIAGGGLLALGIAIFIYRKKKKKAEEVTIDE
ncbi:LPXTG cell wall anchor domain-containing protein [Crassaminicella thermophila]|uniref:LPXTG cell wall anchor domain-containing protein n=1 Tax=Crassaminicella thermophila TaxID=2599308 RepID=A0A5C0SH68_CRATE|nr:LPXTG cell wall anchor domain-containing protein [Crassaminicella thermophila]QEK13671.1 LPXTG cell wall anchor domain-containing protein [Crassaminicella thermophila]